MMPNRAALEGLGRDQLIQEARRFGVRRPEVMTRVELIDEVLRLGTPNPVERKRVRGWLGVARDLVASIVEQGLNLPDAAAMIRGDFRFEPLKPVQPPVATVTLAEIYGAQGHFQKALAMLDEVLAKEPEHEAARKLRDRLDRERVAGARAVTAPGAVASTVFPEEPEPLTPRRASKQPPAATEDDPEPLTPRRASKQPPSAAVDDEPLTPRRLSKQPPPGPEEPEPLTSPSSSAEAVAAAAEEPEPLTPRRLSKQPPAASADSERAPSAEPPAADVDPFDNGAVLVRSDPSRAVVYFELRERGENGAAPSVQVVEWRPHPSGAQRVEHEFVLADRRGVVVVEGLSPESILRAAIGSRRHGRFKPIAVSIEAAVASGVATVVWTPRPSRDYSAIAGRAAEYLAAT